MIELHGKYHRRIERRVNWLQSIGVAFGCAWMLFLIGGGSFLLWLAYKMAEKHGWI